MQLYIDDFDRPGKHAEKFPEVSKIFEQPHCHWYTGKYGDRDALTIGDSIHRLMNRAFPSTPSCVLYNIPNRDAGNYSKGGASDNTKYIEWIKAFAKGLEGNNDPIIVFEPDALCLAVGEWDKPPTQMLLERIELYHQCLPYLQAGGSYLYVDIGHPRWLSPEKAAEVLNMLDPTIYDGFAINVSNFIPLQECIEWGEKVSVLTNGKHFVIDTSRNGIDEHDNDWCNHPLIDAFLWVKVPGESDGYCNNGPKAGMFWPEYALQLLGKC